MVWRPAIQPNRRCFYTTVSASGNQAQALQKYLAEHVPTASVIFVMEDAASVDVFGIAPDHVARLPTIDIESPKQPPPKVAQTNQHLAEPPVSAASQTIAPEPIAQHATSKPRQAVAPQPSRPQSVGPPSLTRDELEALILLSRSLEPDLAFSRQSLAFAMGQAPDAAERLLRRWLQHGVVMPAGRAHDIEVFAVPDAIRRDIADLVA